MNILELDDGWVNDLQKEAIRKVLSRCRHGAKFIDIHMRVDGQEYRFEADWIKYLNRGAPRQDGGGSAQSGVYKGTGEERA